MRQRAVSAVTATGGKIVLVGSEVSMGDSALAPYNTDGSLDWTSGSGGRVLCAFARRFVYAWAAATAAAIQPDGKIIASAFSTRALG